jgi:hypothetical protein
MSTFPMTAEQMDTIRARDWNKLLALGGNIFFIGKIAVTVGLSFAQLAAKRCYDCGGPSTPLGMTRGIRS